MGDALDWSVGVGEVAGSSGVGEEGAAAAAKGVAAAAALEDGDGDGLVVSDVEDDCGATVRSLWQYRHLMASSWIISAQ
ncbi:MAG TPA: hypothetical protein VLB31_06060 [Actinomycetota bacterium]|nr:hypothetical protein [Actinomycetota bacterium]